jgi:hypothetical protein
MQTHQNKTKIFKLSKPDLSKSNMIGFNTGLRPYRKGGIRIEAQNIQDKVVIHNYGHGGGGVSLFFGSCKQSLECFEEDLRKKNLKPKDIMVIGSG